MLETVVKVYAIDIFPLCSKREENLKNAKAHLRAGNVSKAKEYFQRCVEITPAMATEVIQVRL